MASRHPGVPWYAKAVAVLTLSYALSPIDLIPDFVPVLGQLDDLIIVPAGLALSAALIPPQIMAECRNSVQQTMVRPGLVSRVLAGAIVVFWIGFSLLALRLIYGLVTR